MATTSRLLASLCCALAFSGAAHAQASNGDNPSPSGASVDCNRDSYASTSGTGSNRPLHARRAHTGSRQSAAMHGNMPAAYEQCLNGNDRSARAECVRRTYESRVGTSGTGSMTAAQGMRRPC